MHGVGIPQFQFTQRMLVTGMFISWTAQTGHGRLIRRDGLDSELKLPSNLTDWPINHRDKIRSWAGPKLNREVGLALYSVLDYEREINEAVHGKRGLVCC